VEREVEERWEEAEKESAVALKRERTPESAGLWLAIRLQRTGIRPLPAIRAAFPQSRRQWTHRKGAKGLLVSVHLDKDNKVITHLGDGHPSPLRGEPREKFIPGKFIHPHTAMFLNNGDILVAEWVPIGRITLLRKVG
jgi:hypothetical protein